MQYILMRKNQPITVADFSDDGRMIWYSREQLEKHNDIAPLWENLSKSSLIKWWENRSIPIGQNKVKELLEKKHLSCPEEYLMKNLGLSLTDYYWIKPLGSTLCWEDVNFFDNDFQNELSISSIDADDPAKYSEYVPNSSLQGQLDKKWIIVNGKRCLVKGNRDEYSTESLNEVIATKFHMLQKYDNYTAYDLIQIKDTEYDYGCISECFTSQKEELISAYAVITSSMQNNDISSYEHFIKTCGEHGMDTELLRRDLEYMILMDFVMSGRDRHLSNVSILRDAETLKFLRMAPIYDSGKCMFIGEAVPTTDEELLDIKTTSFAKTELKLLSYVTDRKLVDVSKLSGPYIFEKYYSMDSRMDEKRIKKLKEAYEKKVDLLRLYQLGKDLKAVKFPQYIKEEGPKQPRL